MKLKLEEWIWQSDSKICNDKISWGDLNKVETVAQLNFLQYKNLQVEVWTDKSVFSNIALLCRGEISLRKICSQAGTVVTIKLVVKNEKGKHVAQIDINALAFINSDSKHIFYDHGNESIPPIRPDEVESRSSSSGSGNGVSLKEVSDIYASLKQQQALLMEKINGIESGVKHQLQKVLLNYFVILKRNVTTYVC